MSHRLGLAKLALANGFVVYLISQFSNSRSVIEGLGIRCIDVNFFRSSASILLNFKLMFQIWSILRKISPDIIHLVTPKAILIGGIPARLTRNVGVVFAVSGLGSGFIGDSVRAKFFQFLCRNFYRVVFADPRSRIIFQNSDDQADLLGKSKRLSRKSCLIEGSGVIVNSFEYDYKIRRKKNRLITVAFVGRLIEDKGIFEFLQSAEQIVQERSLTRFLIVGEGDAGNPGTTVGIDRFQPSANKSILFLGHRSDVTQLYRDIDIVVLPSYREGFPKVLMEAAAAGLAVVATDVPGCRGAVLEGKTGLLVPARNVEALTSAILKLIDSPSLRESMGKAARQLAEQKFDAEHINQKQMAVYRELLTMARQ